MSVFSRGELLGVDSRTTLRKLAVGENDPADPNALQALTKKTESGPQTATPDQYSTVENRAPVHSAPPSASAVSAADAAQLSGASGAELEGMQDDIRKTIEGLFFTAEAAHYGTKAPAPATTTASTTTGGSGGGGGTGMG